MNFFRKILLIAITFTSLLSSIPYYSLENNEIYSIIEYQILNESDDIYVLNQPYHVSQIKKLLIGNENFYKYFKTNNYYNQKLDDNLKIYATPAAFGRHNLKQNENLSLNISNRNSIGISFASAMYISDILYISEVDINKNFTYEEDFHGDINEYLTGYFSSSYALYGNDKGLELFAGRISRNFGLLNDYGTILSNHPYSFDHFGFSTSGSFLKYSFYTSRLNDVIGIDISGETIEEGVEENCKRFWTIQRLDYKINDNLQFSISESIIYGGPNQQFVASYINPINFFYASQRNQKIQLNGFWQANLFYRIKSDIALYLDLLIDDIILNNEAEQIERNFHPDRLGFLIKLSTSKIKDYLVSLRYARISNETYTSLRTFENYTFYNNSIGFPENSYESIKFSVAYLKKLPFYYKVAFELFQKGEKDLESPFNDQISDFPIGLVSKGVLFKLKFSNFSGKVKIGLNYDLLYNFRDAAYVNDNFQHNINFSIQYYLHKLI